MEITKYNRGNTGYTIGSLASINANNKNNSSSTTTTPSNSDCELWGNHFDGTTDIEDTIFVNGSVYAMPDRYNVDDEDDSDLPEGELEGYESREFEKFEDDNGGNIYAQNLIKSFGDIKATKDIEGSSTYGKTVYLDYPEKKSDDSNKTDLLPLLKDFDGRITTNKSEIDSLKSRVSTAETKITNIDSRVTNNEGDIEDIYLQISNITSTVDGLLPIGSIIMYSGANSIPSGWAICNGENGTPDLRGKFIKAGDFTDNPATREPNSVAYEKLGTTGGNNYITLNENNLPSHSHLVRNYLILVNGDGEINTGTMLIEGLDVMVSYASSNSANPTRRALTDNSGHSHIPYIQHSTFTAGNTDPQGFNIEPSYYTLIFIMKIA